MADSHKAIAKAIKAKGLQKLKFWCELCHKQCRDANGYKNHCTTEGHLRQVALFSQNANAYLDEYSNAFEKAFMELIRRRWRFKDILVKKAYNEYIQDKEHVHMNATRWVTLSDFARHLGKAGLCDVNDSDEGLVLRYIDRDPQREAKQAAMREREREELEQREIERKKLMRTLKALEAQDTESSVASTSDLASSSSPTDASVPTHSSGPPTAISFSFTAPKKKTTLEAGTTSTPTAAPSGLASSSASEPSGKRPESPRNDKKRPHEEDPSEKLEAPVAKKSKLALDEPVASSSTKKLPPAHAEHHHSAPHSKNALDDIMQDQERRREREGRKDHWLHPNIVVKIMNKELGKGEYYGLKGVVMAVEDTYVAKIRLDSGTVLKLDQEDLETVLPALGSHVLVVNGAYRGETAMLQSLNKSDYSANISIVAGPARGRTLSKAYEDICKLA